jgi:hypothetical protein
MEHAAHSRIAGDILERLDAQGNATIALAQRIGYKRGDSNPMDPGGPTT